MLFARKVWKLLVAVKDGLALLFLLLFFLMLYAAMTGRPSAGVVREGALLLKLDGAVVEEPAEVDPLGALLSQSAPTKEYRARDLVRALNTAAKDDRIKAVVLDLSRFTGGGMVHLQEIGAAMDGVRAAKKPVLVWAMAYADDGVMLGAHASEIWVDPMGGSFVLGPGGNNLYFGELLQRLKITAHVYRVGTYKDFVEPYLLNRQSEPSKQAKQAIYAALWDQWKADVAKARPKAQIDRVTSDPVGWLKASSGDAAEAALAAGLVDRIGDRTAFGKRVAQVAGKDPYDKLPGAFAHTTLKAWLGSHPVETPGKAIGVITIAGEIVDGKAGPGSAGGDRIARALDEALDKDLAGLVVRVDSPGGSVTASEAIRTAIQRHRARGIPVAVSMANMAASGGYWVSTPGQRVFAEPATITGSIGIFAIMPSFEKALASWGVTGDGVRTTPLSGQPDVITGLTPEVDAMLQSNIERGYARFVGLVAKARGRTPEQIDAIAQGRVWDGGTARQNGLVDQFGGLDDALAWTAKQAKLADGDWHAEFLGAQETPYANLLQSLSNDDGEGADPAAGRDLFALVAQRQQGRAAQAASRFAKLFGSAGAQAYCLDCPAPAGAAPQGKGSLLAVAARWLGLD